MPRFKAQYDERFEVNLPATAAAAHFGDVDQIARCYPNIDSHRRIDDETLFIQLMPQSEKGFRFHGSHTCRWQRVGTDRVRWTTTESDDTWTSGELHCVDIGGGRSRVTYSESFELEMEANKLLAKLARVVVERNIRVGIRDYLVRMRAGIS